MVSLLDRLPDGGSLVPALLVGDLEPRENPRVRPCYGQ